MARVIVTCERCNEDVTVDGRDATIVIHEGTNTYTISIICPNCNLRSVKDLISKHFIMLVGLGLNVQTWTSPELPQFDAKRLTESEVLDFVIDLNQTEDILEAVLEH